mgnify:CR=1 FL=1
MTLSRSRSVSAFWRPPSFEARQRVKILAAGTVAAIGPQVLLAGAAAFSDGQAPENALGWTGALFPLAIGYAVLRHDLLTVDGILTMLESRPANEVAA